MTLERRSDDQIDVTVELGDEVSTFVFVRETSGMSAWSAEGRLLARVMDVNGEPMLVAGALAR